MTREKLAEVLTGREYPLRLTCEEVALAKESGLVVVYGASDDLMEFEGAIYDEIGCNDGGTAYLLNGKLYEMEQCDCDHARRADEQAKAQAKKIEALWCAEEGYSWTYKTDIPHVTFEIVEDSEPYCRGIVFDLKDVLV